MAMLVRVGVTLRMWVRDRLRAKVGWVGPSVKSGSGASLGLKQTTIIKTITKEEAKD